MDLAGTAYLEDLHILNALLATALVVDRTPLFDDALDIRDRQTCEGQVVPRVEAQDVASALTRITFTEESTSKPLHRTIEMAAQLAQSPRSLFIVAGRSRRMAVDSHQAELRQLIAEKGISVGSEAPKTLGDVAAAYVATGVNASLVVLQACA